MSDLSSPRRGLRRAANHLTRASRRHRTAIVAFGALAAVVGALAGVPSAASALTPAGDPTSVVGARKYLVVGCAFADTRVSTLGQADGRIRGLIPLVSQYIRHSSNWRLSFDADYAGWASLPKTSRAYDVPDQWKTLDDDCDTAVLGALGRMGRTVDSYDGYIELYSLDLDRIAHPNNPNYKDDSLTNNTGRSWLLADKERVALRFDGGIAGGWVSPAAWIHELGHSFGLQHSRDETSSGSDYNNPYDVMSDLGASTSTTPFGGVSVCNDSRDFGDGVYQCVKTLNGTVPQDLAMFQKDLLGWLNPQTEVATPTFGRHDYQITAPQYDPSGALPNVRLVKVAAGTASATHYYAIEYKRTSHGPDSDPDAIANNWSAYDAGLTGAGDRVLVYDVRAPAPGESSAGAATLVRRLTAGETWSSGGRVTVKDNGYVNGLDMAASVSIDVTDGRAPTITAADHQTYSQHAPAFAQYSCDDQQFGSGVQSCTGTVANGAPLNTDTPGAYEYIVTAVDRVGNTATETVHYRVTDDTRPTIALTAPTAAGRYAMNADVRASYSCGDADSGIDSCSGTVANGAPVDTATLGTHVFTVTARDRGGNTASQTVSYTVVADRTRPTISITAPTATRYAQFARVTLHFACSDETGGSGIATCSGPRADGAYLDTRATGTFVFTVTAQDRAGNATTAHVRYTVVPDSAPPAVTITSPRAGEWIPWGTTIDPGFSCVDEPNGSGIAINGCVPTLDGQPLPPTGDHWFINTWSLARGEHVLRVDGTDWAGNHVAAERTFSLY